MVIEEKLKQIDQEVESGEIDSAKNRLHGLLTSHPNRAAVRRKLGEIYWQLDQPEMAGRYWFLIEAETPEMVAANYAFALGCDNDPLEILRRLEFKGDVMKLDHEFGQFMLLNLKREAQKRYGANVDIEHNKRELDTLMEPLFFEKQPLPRRVLNWTGCIIALVLPFALIAWGTVALLRWLT